MGDERYDDSFGAWRFVHFSSICGAAQQDAILLEAQNYWPRTERLFTDFTPRRTGREAIFILCGEHKIMNHFVVRSNSPLKSETARKFAQ